MKNLQRFCAAVVLTLTFTLSAFAGDIPFPGAEEPPPPPQHSQMASDPATSDSTSDAVTDDPITEALLSLLQSILPVL
jgi:hypothetical protein